MSNVIELSTALRDELAQNSQPAHVDPRSVPLRFSTMKRIGLSPLHYYWSCQNQFEETLSTRLGSGAHAILFGTPYRVWEGRRAGKSWDKFEADHPGETILTTIEYEKAWAMSNAIRSHATANRLLFTNTILERRIDWEWQGRAYRSTPDACSRTMLVDLKCLRSADPDAIMWQSKKMAYHAQMATYRRCLNSTGHNIKDVYLVVVENKPPWPVTVLRFTETALEEGDCTAADWLEKVLACEERGEYPGYTSKIEDLDLPVTQDELVFADDNEGESEHGI